MSKSITLRDMVFAALFAALISILSLISIPLPFSPVAITGQTLGIMLAGSILKPRQAALSVGTYLLMGIIGLPVFAGGSAGLGVLVGKSGGYLVGFLVGAMLISLIKGQSQNLLRLATANLIGGILVVYFLGISWLVLGHHIPAAAAILSNLAYIPGDIAKLVIATTVALASNKQLKPLLEAKA